MLKKKFVNFSVILIFFVFINNVFAENNRIFKINILGNEKIEKAAIMPFIKSKIGDVFSPEKVKEDVKSIYRMGYFENVIVNYNKLEKGIELSFIVVEKPYIKLVRFEGIKKLKKSEVTKELITKPFTIINEEKIKKDVEKIVDVYQEKGFYGVKVSYKISKPVNHKVVVTFKIIEGIKSKIDHVYIKGNSFLSSRRVKKAIYTKPYNFLISWITGTGYLKKSELDKDVKRIENLYHTYGFVRVKVFEPVIKVKDKGKYLDITFTLEEGKRYKFEKVEITDPKGSPELIKKLLKKLKCQPSDYFNNLYIHKDIGKLTDEYADMGYAFADVSPKTLVDDKTLTVDLNFIIDRGKLYKFREIFIEGNTITRDKVIRRELRVYEQEKYSSTGLKRSRGNLKRTGYFSEVDIKTEKVSDDSIDVHVKVKETPTGSLSFGGGYSSAESFILTGQISQNNLFGKGYKLKLDAALSGISQRYNISFTDPAILDTNVSFGFSMYELDYEYDNYDTLKKGLGFSFGRRISDYTRWDASYYYESVKVYNVDYDAADYIKDEEGKTKVATVSFSITKDSRDDFYYPLSGVKQRLYTELSASFLGGEEDYYKIILESTWFHPLNRRKRWVFDFRVRVGYIGKLGNREIPAWERFYVGGLKTLRGFKYGKAGPRDESGDVKGGTKEIITNTEIRFPLIEEIGINGDIFFDAGRAFDNDESISLDLRKSIGAGLSWRSPFGLIRIEYGINLSPKSDEKSSVWGFSMGTMF
jgi:outer membrane protein insertion porin family